MSRSKLLDPERKLACAVILQTVRDATRPDPDPLRDDALKCVFEYPEMLQFWCRLAQVKFEAIRDRIEDLPKLKRMICFRAPADPRRVQPIVPVLEEIPGERACAGP